MRRRRSLAFSDVEWEVNPGYSDGLATSGVPSAAPGCLPAPFLASSTLYLHGWGDTAPQQCPQQSPLPQAHFQLITGLITNLFDLICVNCEGIVL